MFIQENWDVIIGIYMYIEKEEISTLFSFRVSDGNSDTLLVIGKLNLCLDT